MTLPGRIDVHSHLLPDVDDGCPEVEDSLECARRLAEAGYTHIFCTPHVVPDLPENRASIIGRKVQWLQDRVRREGLDVTLLPGGEINLQSMWPMLREMPPEEIPSFANARRYCLADFWGDRLPDGFDAAVQYLRSLGMQVIIAHPERVRAFQDDPRLWEHMADLGVPLQGNLQCFSDPDDSPTRVLIEQKAREGAYWLLGTDCHWPEMLDLRIDGLRIAIEVLGDEVVDRLTRHHPRQLLPWAARRRRYRVE